ncbi:17500_t:CDS:2 [Cetraspora pellucida]|uniref:17500_t:CDS:1 n=1 Tax=Cetraspora pellucida TaxID=1433469 RepID=A0A9N9I4C3_9GLOM|nr:17500_t:CDS:2 [Cetraspora pellucida]
MADHLEHDALRKHKSRENETPDQRQNRFARDRDNKMKRKSAESAEEHRERLDKEKGQKKQRRALNVADVNLNNQDNEQMFDLTEIEEMLIAQIFPVISVYCLRGGQYTYKGNVINFPQDVHEFAIRLPRQPSSLDVLVVRRQSASGPAFRDFNVRCVKIAKALIWLKSNNRYYANIEIDNEALQSLPENGPIDNYLPQVQNTEDESLNDDENETDDIIIRNFVPVSPRSHRENDTINDALARMQTRNTIAWPNIDGNSNNEFHTPGYIMRAFPTLYPYGKADLHSERLRDVKPAEYFQHMLKYKDGRFAQHTC